LLSLPHLARDHLLRPAAVLEEPGHLLIAVGVGTPIKKSGWRRVGFITGVLE
jgi:hypothetical protein